MKEMGGLGEFPCAGSYAEVVAPAWCAGRSDSVRARRAPQGALAATIEMMSAALAAGK